MKRVRWAVAMILILAMMMLGGCSGQNGSNDGPVQDSVTDDGRTDGGILNDIADDVEDGINDIRDGMDTIEDDTRTDLGNGGSNGSGSQMTN